MKQFLHFGAEVGESAKKILALGAQIDVFFNQNPKVSIPLAINMIILSALWAGIWSETKEADLRMQMEKLILNYDVDVKFKKEVDDLVIKSKTFSELVNYIRRNSEFITSRF